MVRVYVYNKHGLLVGPVESPRLELTQDEWRERLTPAQFQIARASGTERPFCGTLLDNRTPGVYSCVCCGLPLFSSDSKFKSGTGWPSFFQPVARENVAERSDRSHGMDRTEIQCARCDGHLGHVFEDGPRPTGLRYCVNSESLEFTPAEQLADLADDAAIPSVDDREQTRARKPAERKTTAAAVLAGGCFWCTEAAFEQLQGVLDVESGYAGGQKHTATYEQVCRGDTGHAEVIRITYDPRRISYERLLDVFFDAHDPTQLNRQGNDMGTQYRSAIFFATDDELRIAEAKIRQLSASGVYHRSIVTTLEPLEAYFPAEQYHQDYARQHPDQPYIQMHALPKACKIREKHADLAPRAP
ncbi:MAG: bifunctional methionine sulfoxide reductase B/A protein [Planctomycetales bacterium]